MMYELFILLPNINMNNLPSLKVFIFGISSIVIFFLFGIALNAVNHYYSRGEVILRQMASNNKVLAEDAETLIQERAHCAIADELQAGITKLQDSNASLKRQFELLAITSKKE